MPQPQPSQRPRQTEPARAVAEVVPLPPPLPAVARTSIDIDIVADLAALAADQYGAALDGVNAIAHALEQASMTLTTVDKDTREHYAVRVLFGGEAPKVAPPDLRPRPANDGRDDRAATRVVEFVAPLQLGVEELSSTASAFATFLADRIGATASRVDNDPRATARVRVVVLLTILELVAEQ